MVTHRCRWCGEVYLPKQGAVRTFFCSRSHREKYSRWSKKVRKNRGAAKRNPAVQDVIRDMQRTAPNRHEIEVAMLDALSLVEPLNQLSAALAMQRISWSGSGVNAVLVGEMKR